MPDDPDERLLAAAYPGWRGPAVQVAALLAVVLLTGAVALPLVLVQWPSGLDQQPWSTVTVALVIVVPFAVLSRLCRRVLVRRARRRLDDPR